jgi:hypothetical protein
MINRHHLGSTNVALLTLLALAGCTGPIGPRGPAGPPGANGATGANGSDGTNGHDGQNGATGANGANGTNGLTTPTPYTQTFAVAAGADQAANGAALLKTLAAISTGDAQARYLVQIGAGVFDVADKVVTTPASVDLVGAGEAATRIIGAIGVGYSGVLAPGGAVRDLTVEDHLTVAGLYSTAIYIAPKTSATLDHVTAIAEAAAAEDEGFAIYVDNNGSLSLSDVTALASGSNVAIGLLVHASPATVTAQNLRVQTQCTPGLSTLCLGVSLYGGTFSLTSGSIIVKGGGATKSTNAIDVAGNVHLALTAVDATAEGATGIGLAVKTTTGETTTAQLDQVTLTGAANSLAVSVVGSNNPQPGNVTIDFTDSQLAGPIGNSNPPVTILCVNSLSGTSLLDAICN